METLINDLRLAARRLGRQPMFTCIAILTLAIGIGANSAIFTLVNGVLLRALPFHNPDELVWIHGVTSDGDNDVLSAPVFLALQSRSRSFTDVAMYASGSATVTGLGDAERISGGDVSASYFDVIGVKPLLGGVLPADANQVGKTHVVLLSESMWREKYGAARDVVGRTITLDGQTNLIVGVLPESATFPTEWKYWRPLEYTESFTNPRNVFALWLTVIGRMKPGVTTQQADADVAAIMDQAEADGNKPNPKWSAATLPLHEMVTGAMRTPLLVLLGAVGLVLLIACANLANLLLAQAAARSTDFAVRRALGASPWRLVRQLLVESVALAALGGSAGLLLGAWGADALMAMLPPGISHMPNVHLDWAVVEFTAFISLTAAIAFGMAPAMQARHGRTPDMLRAGARGVVSRGSVRTRAALVIGETALAFSLLIGAGLLIRSFHALTNVDPGFKTDHTLSFEVALPDAQYETDEKAGAFYDQVIARVSAIPGVVSAGAISNLPLGGGNAQITFNVAGRPERPEEAADLEVHVATPGYFKTLGIPLKRGRLLEPQDRAGTPPVALLSEQAVKTYFANEDPIGKHIVMGWRRNGVRVEGTVVGIVGDTRQSSLRDAAYPVIYFTEAQVTQAALDIAVRTAGDPKLLSKTISDVVHGMDSNLPLAHMRALDEVVDSSVASDRFMTLLLSVFSTIAVLLAAVGIFGVISYGVTQRRREFGVRMAVGASRGEIVGLVLSGAARLAAAGLVIGGLGAFALTRVMGALLFDVEPGDPLTYVVGALGLFAVALAASALPAWSASRLPPSAVLNTD